MVHASDIQFPGNGHTAMGYLSYPKTSEPVPGIVVLQEWWGLDGHIRSIVDRFAAEGFAALAPDLYHGVVTTEPDDARKEAMNLDRARAMQEINGAVTYLQAQNYVQPKQIGMIGFCMGGGIALHIAAHNPDVGAVAAFYGGGSPEVEAFADSKTAVLNIVGDRDRVLPTIQELEAGFSAYAFPHKLIVYPEAEHAFFNDTRPHIYKADAAEDAWSQALSWFRRYLV